MDPTQITKNLYVNVPHVNPTHGTQKTQTYQGGVILAKLKNKFASQQPKTEDLAFSIADSMSQQLFSSLADQWLRSQPPTWYSEIIGNVDRFQEHS